MEYRTIEKSELDLILKRHAEWLLDNTKGQRADLSSADLSYANLRSADLSSANLLIFKFNRNTAYFTLDGTLRIGCICMPITEWVLCYAEIGAKEGYSPTEIKAYGALINICLDTFNTEASK